MSVQNYPKRWTFKPPPGVQINGGHPLSMGLVGCWLMNDGAGINIKDLVTNRPAVMATLSAPYWGTGLMGSYVDQSNANNNVRESSFPFINFPMTAIVWVQVRINLLNGEFFFAHDDGTTAANGYNMNITSSGTGVCRFQVGGVHNSFTNLVMAINIWYMYAVTCDKQSGTAWGYLSKLGSGGVTSQSVAVSTFTGTPSVVSFGMFGATLATQHYTAQALFYQRVLTPGEIQMLAIDPLCFLNPMSQRRQNEPSAGVSLFADRWHPRIEQPYLTDPEVVTY